MARQPCLRIAIFFTGKLFVCRLCMRPPACVPRGVARSRECPCTENRLGNGAGHCIKAPPPTHRERGGGGTAQTRGGSVECMHTGRQRLQQRARVSFKLNLSLVLAILHHIHRSLYPTTLCRHGGERDAVQHRM